MSSEFDDLCTATFIFLNCWAVLETTPFDETTFHLLFAAAV